jgi:hypothetical protein
MTSSKISRHTATGQIAFALLLACAVVLAPRASSLTVFGPETFTRTSGRPSVETRRFSVPAVSRLYTLHAENHGVESAVVRINGAIVLRPDDFEADHDDRDRDGKDRDGKDRDDRDRDDRDRDRSGNDRVRVLERRVALLLSNQLSVELRGEPGRSLVVWITCDDCDSIPPTITGSTAPPPNASGWNNSNVTVSFSCADADSGIASCTPPIVVSQDGASQVVVGTAVDGAGNTATTSLTVNLDKTAPTIAANLPPSSGGWYRDAVAVSFACSDATSGIATCTPPTTVSANGPTTVTGTATDRAGNKASTSAIVSIDTLPPTISAVVTPAANAAGWRTGDVTVSFSCADLGSGVAVCPAPIVVTTDGANQKFSGTAIDQAGNIAVATVSVDVDKGAPTIAAQVSPPPNASGWNNGDVTVSFSCADSGSGVASCPSSVVLGAEGTGQIVSRTATDAAGNSASTSVTLNIDKTMPTIVASTSPAPNSAGWNTGSVTVTFTCADAGSGIATCPQPITVSTDVRNQPVTGTAVDKAGNTASATTSVSVDTTGEVITASIAPPPNAAGWNNTSVTITFQCADAGSGTGGCPDPVVVSSDGADQRVSRTAFDVAGNSSTATVTLNVDQTPPTVQITGPADGATSSTATTTLTGTVADSVSGVARATCNGAAAPVVNGIVTCPVTINEGANTLTISATDVAGNTASRSVGVTFAPDRRPTAALAVSTSAIAGQPVQFDATQSSDPDRDALTFSWDFGDGSTGSGPSPSHTYQTAGAFDIVLTVDDGRGSLDTARLHLDVAAASHGLGRGMITGRVFNDGDGLPIADATVDLVSVSGSSAFMPAQTSTDALGRFRLSSPVGRARLHISKDGFTAVDRFVDVADSQRADPLDARLTALDARSVTVTSVLGNVVSNTAGDLRLTIPAGALSNDANLRLTRVGGTGSAGALPLGWSPVAAFDLAPASLTWTMPATIVVPAPPGLPANTAPLLAKWNAQSGAWSAVGGATRAIDGVSLQTTITASGQYVLVLPDQAPNAPPQPGLGAVLAGVASVASPDAQVTITPSPKILFDSTSAHSTVRVLVTPTQAVPSGSLLRLDAAESYALTDATSLFLPRAPRQLPLYRYSTSDAPAGGLTLQSRTVATPSRVFAPFRLQRGAIDLAARLPGQAAPYGSVISAAGGQVTDARGDRFVVPAGASQDDLPVAIAPLDPSDVAAPLPSGLALVGAVDVDLHGATLSIPAMLSIPAPSGIGANTPVLVVRLTEAEGITQLELVAVGAVQGESLLTSTDPFDDGSLLFPGVNRDGWYLFLKASQAVGFVTGVATASDGTPLAGAVVSGGTLGLVAVTTGEGRYSLASAPGDATFTTRNAVTADQTTFTAHVAAGAVAAQSSSVGVTFLSVVSTSPTDGAATIPLTSSVRATFSNAIDPSSVAGALTVSANAGPVAGSLTLTPDGRSLVFRPGTLLAANTTYQVTIGGAVRSVGGRPLPAPAVAHFTTLNTTPPVAPAAGAVTATIPGDDGLSTVAGTQGTADPGGVVLVKNLTTGAITTLTPNADGSFSGRVAAAKADRLQLTLKDASGNATTVPIDPFRNADGSVIVGSAGGRVTGNGGTFADVPPGALPDGTVVKVEPLQAASFNLDAPAGFPFAAGLRVSLGGVTARQEIHVGVQAPPGASAQDQVLVAAPVDFVGRRVWTVIDRAHLTGDKYASESPPFPGVTADGSYAFLRVNGDCVSYVSVQFDFTRAFALADLGMPFFYPTTIFFRQVTMPAICNSQVNVQVLNPDTGAAIRTAAFLASPTRDDIVSPPDILTDDTVPPSVVTLNSPTGHAVDQLQIVFSKSLNDDTVKQNFKVLDRGGQAVAGTIELDVASTIVTFRPFTPFLYGVKYSVQLYGVTDHAGNLMEGEPLTFTPFDPQSLVRLQQIPALQQALDKCTSAGCSGGVFDIATIGNTMFVANGLRTTDEHYRDPANPKPLLAVDVTDPVHPVLIGVDTTATNPRALAVVENAAFLASSGAAFAGNLLLVASGGSVANQGLLASELAVYDVSACTRRPLFVPNCLAGTLKGFKALSTADNSPPLPGVPPDTGIPLQVAALHQKGDTPNSDVVLAYVAVAGIGLEAVDVTTAFNLSTTNRAPDGLMRGDYFDVAVLKNRVLATGQNAASNEFRLTMFNGQLGHLIDLPPPPPPGLAGFNGAARLGVAESVAFDVDGDGHIGTAAAHDNNPAVELFDLAVVSSGPRYANCAGSPPCGELYIVDLSANTDLGHTSGPRVLDYIPLPGAPFSVQLDPVARLAYVEIRGRGLAVVDLTYLINVLRGGAAAPGLIDRNGDGVDDRVLRIVPTGAGQNDILMTRLKVDTKRGVAYVSGTAGGVELIQVTNQATELALDFNANPATETHSLPDEQVLLKSVVDKAVAALRSDSELRALWSFIRTTSDPETIPVWVLEQGSGACFWRVGFPKTCSSFQPGLSDHDLEFFVPQALVVQTQRALDDFRKKPDSDLNAFGDLSTFAMSKEAFEAAELLNGTPLYKTGDTTGDLGMGRQTLLLLWILEGEYVPGYAGPDLSQLLSKLKNKPQTDPVFPANQPPEPSGIPRLEGYEWAKLQEFNLYKTGAMVRFRGGCDSTRAPSFDLTDIEAIDPGNDPDKAFNDRSFFGTGCHDQIHGVAKAAIRAALARIVADTAGNPLILQIDPSGQNDLGAYRRTGCFDVGEPPFDLATTNTRPCRGFEEYIATVALKAARAGLQARPGVPLFNPDQLRSVFRFWCAKVDCDVNASNPIVQSDEQADAFIREAIAFIAFVQQETVRVYTDTLAFDRKTIGALPYLDVGPPPDPGDAQTPGVGQICTGALANSDLTGQMLPGVFLPQPLTGVDDRKFLRLCNLIIVDRKTNGDQTVTASPATLGPFQLDGKSLKDTKKRLGAKNYVHKDLKVRALNMGAQTASVNLALYDGNGSDPLTYRVQKTVPLQLEPGARREISEEPKPDNPDEKQPLFPALFGLGSPGTPRAFAFVIDPEHAVPEADRTDNQASLFYYVLNPSSNAVPSTADAPVDAVDTSPDPLAIPQPDLAFTLRVRSAGGGTPYGGKDVTVAVFDTVQLKYEVRNFGTSPLKNIEIARLIGNRMRIVARVDQLAPKGQTGDAAFFTDSESFTPTEPAVYPLRAVARAIDKNGNSVGPLNDIAYVTASEALATFDVKLYDETPLSDIQHPLSRFHANHDSTDGHSLPLIGAVTDGGGPLRVRIDGLRAFTAATILVGDGELPDVTDGVGSFTSDHVLQMTLNPDSAGHAEVDYYPPPVFVRDGHRSNDFAKTQRVAKITVLQTGLGSTTQRVVLRRPPVFLVHGLFAARHRVDAFHPGAWDQFQPLVPPAGFVSGDYTVPVAGFDGRFDLFAVGESIATSRFADGAATVQFQIKQALDNYLPGFAISKVDVIAHSMGGLLTNKLANENPRIAAAIHKVVTLDSPFNGSALADAIAEIRGREPIKKNDLPLVDALDPKSYSSLTGPVKIEVKLDWCAMAIQSAGWTPAFFIRGAIDDLRPGSAEIGALRAAGVTVPNHRVSVEMSAIGGGATAPVIGLWAALGLLCNLTPDASTVEATIQLRLSKDAIKTVLGVRSALGEADSAARLEGLLGAYKSTVKLAVKDELRGDPKTVFSGANDRVVEGPSQLGSISASDQATTAIVGLADHVSVKQTPGVQASACLGQDTFVRTVRDFDGDSVPDVVCKVMWLLEADPDPPPPALRVFFKNP